MTAPPRIIRLDVEAAQTFLLPPDTSFLLSSDLAHVAEISQEHDGAEILEPIGAKGCYRHGVGHWVGIAFFYLKIQLAAEVVQESWGY